MRNSILGTAAHDLSNTKTKILGATPGAIPGIGGKPHERFSFAPAFSERFFENWGGPRAPECLILNAHVRASKLGPRLRGQANANLRFSAVSRENLWFSAKICVSQMLCFLGNGGILQKSPKICVWARFVPLGLSP